MKISRLDWIRQARPVPRLMAGVALLMAAALSASAAVGVSSTVPLGSNALIQIQALMAEKDSRTPAQQKMDSQLIYAFKAANGQPAAPGVTLQKIGADVDAQGMVPVDITATVSDDLLNWIKQSGGLVINSFAKYQAIRARLPLAIVESLAARPDVKYVRPAVPARTHTGSVDSQGDTTHRAIAARSTFLATGAGVKVGVLSDSVDFMAQSQLSGDLPANLTVLPGQSGVPGTGEGSAMLEIIHDLAPDAQLFFATGEGGTANFAQNILNLRAAGCDIIVDDLGYDTQTPFQDDIVAQAAESIIADGGMYFSAAGNEGNLTHGMVGTWEGDFKDGGALPSPGVGRFHSFGTNIFDPIVTPGSKVLLYWSDPQGGSSNDYDLIILSADQQTVISSSTSTQNGTQDPFESAIATAPGQLIVIVKHSGAARFLHIDNFRGQIEIGTAGNIRGHPCAPHVFGVSASDANIPFPKPFERNDTVEDFSSDGPRRLFYFADGTPITPGNFLATGGTVRNKPDITAADGVATSVPGFNPFYGTSAAAPHAAAIAALLKSYNVEITPQDIRTLLTSTAIDIEAPGYDTNSGAGIIMAYEALAAAPLPAPTPRLQIGTNIITGGNGNGMIDFNECNDLSLTITNLGRTNATGIQVTLSTTTPGVYLTQSAAQYVDLPAGGQGVNLTPFRISTVPTFVCGTPVVITAAIKCDQNSKTDQFTILTGTPDLPVRFSNSTPVAIPDNNPVGAVSPVTVSNINGAIAKVAVSLHIQHTFVGDLTLKLIGPDGTTNVLAANVGLNGQNYGMGCDSDAVRTIFDDSASVSINDGAAPFVGTFKPQDAFSSFRGKFGSAVNGTWQLLVVDGSPVDTGTIECWSLIINPVQCQDGGGACPGTDLVLGMSDFPKPAIVGSNMVYTITVSNAGPNSASSVIMAQNLPPNVAFISATTSQGGVSQNGGVVTANLATLAAGAAATITVTVLPLAPGSVVSTATVSSLEPDINLANNTVSLTSLIQNPTADLRVSLAAAPNPALVGGSLTYSATVINGGPATASGVVITNTLPISVAISSATVSQGTATINGNTVVCAVGAMTNGASVTATINTTPLSAGTIFATARVAGNLSDPNQANNVMTIGTVVGQSADLGITLVEQPNPVVVNGTITYLVAVTNRGPNVATSVVVNQTLASAFTLTSSNASQGTITAGSGAAVWNVGTLAVGSAATMTLQGRSATTGTLNTSASVNALQADPNPADNSASASTVVAPPFVSIVSAGAALTAESFSPANGAVDVGETVTLDLRLRNAGNVPNTNLVATLLPGGGVTAPSGPQIYGVLPPGGLPVAKSFTFTAAGTNGGVVTATLQLSDAGNPVANVVYTFALPRQFNFTNLATITIPDVGTASPYPSALVVSGITGTVGQVTATLSNLNHTYTKDLDVLLVGPAGQKVLLMSQAGSAGAVNATVTFSDSASQSLPSGSPIVTGTWRPANYGSGASLPAPAPLAPYSGVLSAFNNISPNGTWSLYIVDRNAGDSGQVTSGWSLGVTTITPVNQIADLAIAGAVDSPGLVDENSTWTFTVTNRGPNAATGVGVTNLLSSNLAFVSASSSQGVCTAVGNTVLCSLGGLGTNASATVTVIAKSLSAGAASVTAVVTGSEVDLNLANNSAVVSATNNLPVADMAVGIVGAPIPAIVGSNLTLTITATNNGPGKALGTVATLPVPPGAIFQSATPSKGSAVLNGNSVICSFGNLVSGEVVSADIVLIPNAAGMLTNTVTVATSSVDTNAANNTATAVLPANNPAPILLAAGSAIVSESFTPPNLSIDPGETVMLALSLTNVGQLPTAALTATLQPTGGVGSPSGPQNYGIVQAGGPAVARNFSFTAPNTPGAVITATLVLNDNGTPRGSVSFRFTVSRVFNLANTTAINIPDHGIAAPYPSLISVSGVTGQVGRVTVTLNGFTHTFPADVDVLLVGPHGQQALLMSDVGGGYDATNLVLSFDDASPTPLPQAAPLVSGTFQPTDYPPVQILPPPAPSDPAGTALGVFSGTDPNGGWQLFVADHSVGDLGAISGGWGMQLSIIEPMGSVGVLPAHLAGGFDASGAFVVTLTGQPGASYILQGSQDFSAWSNIATNTTSVDGTTTFTDTAASGFTLRFYRALRQSP
jgi:uncharacterized repeat protein (TIGR01451 family)